MYHHVDQRSPEWFALRKGRVGSSEAYKLFLVDPKSPYDPKTFLSPDQYEQPSAYISYNILLRATIAERNNQPVTHYPPTTNAMQYGIDNEERAFLEFMQWTNLPGYHRPGIYVRGEWECSSPDYIVYDEQGEPTLLEIKCKPACDLPSTPFTSHVIQVQHQMDVTGIPRALLYYWCPLGTRVFQHVPVPQFRCAWQKALAEFTHDVQANL
jgi:hypothetical protein